VVQWLSTPRHHDLLDKLLKLGISTPQPVHVAVTEGPLLGKSFCVTGILSRKREDVHAEIRAGGGRVDDGVKKDTTYLVAGDKTGQSKRDQAKKLGTRVIDEVQLSILLAGGELEALPEPPPKPEPKAKSKATAKKKAKKEDAQIELVPSDDDE
jgi:DNA ligase (NAD+)